MLVGKAYKRWLRLIKKCENLFGKDKKEVEDGAAINQTMLISGKRIGIRKVTDDEALAAALILHKRDGAYIPLSEEKIISKLRVKPERIKKILKKFKKAVDVDF